MPGSGTSIHGTIIQRVIRRIKNFMEDRPERIDDRMNLRKSIFIFYSALILALQACNATGSSSVPSPDVGNMASTLVAMTFQAATQSSGAKPTEPAPTPTTRPSLYINNTVPCRTGTKPNFRIVATFNPGTVVEMLGKNTADSAWLVKLPNSGGFCWVLAQDASPSGSYGNLPEVTPQPSTQKLPVAPASLSWPFICSYVQGNVYEVKINLSWTNYANDANGYRVYSFDTQITDLPDSITTFSDSTNVNLGSQLIYSVEAYNDAGVSPRKSITINSICSK